jgi:hypothetical protein
MNPHRGGFFLRTDAAASLPPEIGQLSKQYNLAISTDRESGFGLVSSGNPKEKRAADTIQIKAGVAGEKCYESTSRRFLFEDRCCGTL